MQWYYVLFAIWVGCMLIVLNRRKQRKYLRNFNESKWKFEHPARKMTKRQKASAERRMTAYRVMQIAQTKD